MISFAPERMRRWRDAIRPYARPAPAAQPGTSALLVVDMQQHFAGMAAPILPRVRHAIDACHEARVPVLLTQHGHSSPDVDGGLLAEWWDELILFGTPDHAFLPDLGNTRADVVIEKQRYSAFFGTDLEQRLRALGVADLAIAGVMTNICVETTARDAFMRDFRVRVLMDATTTSSEKLHLGALVGLAYTCAHVHSVDEWLQGLTRAR